LLRKCVLFRFSFVFAAALATATAGCSSTSELFDKKNDAGWFSQPLDVFAKPEWASNAVDSKGVELGPKGPVAAEDLVSADGRCALPVTAQAPQTVAQPAPETPQPADRPVGSVAGDLAGAPMPAPTTASAATDGAAPGIEPGALPVLGGIALAMTECDVVRRAGLPSNVSISVGEKGERKVVLTYLSGTWPGIYTFASGRLKEINRAPEPPKPAKTTPKKKSKKTVKPKTAATQVR
jgi:hypothetical protein